MIKVFLVSMLIQFDGTAMPRQFIEEPSMEVCKLHLHQKMITDFDIRGITLRACEIMMEI